MKLLSALSAVAAMALAAGCATSTVHAEPTPSVSGPSACADLGGTVDGAQTCHVQTVTDTYKVDVSFPLDYPELNAVTAFLKKDRDGFVDWVGQYGQPMAGDQPYEYSATATTYRAGSSTSGTQSLVLKVQENTGATHQGHPDTYYQAFNYDLGKRVPITFDTLFKPDAKPLDVLNPIVHRELIDKSSRDWDPHPDEPDAHTYRNFAITDDAVTFFFGENEVVHDNNGPRRVSVPRTELAPLLS